MTPQDQTDDLPVIRLDDYRPMPRRRPQLPLFAPVAFVALLLFGASLWFNWMVHRDDLLLTVAACADAKTNDNEGAQAEWQAAWDACWPVAGELGEGGTP